MTRLLIARIGIAQIIWLLSFGSLAKSDQDLQSPKRHFTVEHPANLSGEELEAIYIRLRDDLVAAYRLSGMYYAADYVTWRRYNIAPYRSTQHGNRFINNYANERAKSYQKFENAGRMPTGAILAKDSFAVTEGGKVFGGPLFVMEKMAPGFKPSSADWRYTMIMPDGSLLGTTNGTGSERVEFCAACHALAGDKHDHMFFVPKDVRRDPGD